MNGDRDLALGRYQLISLLGRGGMAEVYKAYHPGLDRYVAIKMLHPHLADEPGFVSRFEREAAIVARLRHPNIVQVIDFDCQNGRYYMVMEFIQGATLREEMLVRSERGEVYTVGEACGVISGIASALEYAHAQGMVHRDVKPANIMLTMEGQAVLTDFGIVHILGATAFTETGGILGTPAYLSPEQGRGGGADIRGDIYSLGVVLYEMTTGRLPYQAETPLGLIQQHLEASPPAPREIDSSIPAAVEVVILKALARNPDDRYQTPLELAEALREAAGVAESEPGIRKISLERRKCRLPLQTTPFVGRLKELRALDELLGRAEVRLVTVLGAGGMGKTRLALTCAEQQYDAQEQSNGRLVPRFPYGVYFVPLAGVSEASHIAPAIADALDFRLEGKDPHSGMQSTRLPEVQVLDYLRKKRLLLVLDNFEHLLEGSSLVIRILQEAPDVRILVTSREQLRLQEENVFQLEGMSYPQVEKAARVEDFDAGEYSALLLFEECARRAVRDFSSGGEQIQQMVHICRLVEGMPLGIELAAAWVDMLSLEEIADEIQTSLDFLESDLRDLPARHRSMRALFDATWARLSEREQEVFSQLSVFQGGFTREAGLQVAGSNLRLLGELTNKSLLKYARQQRRYEIHELLRQYGEHRLSQTPEAERGARERHSAYYLEFLVQHEVHLKGERQAEAQAEIESEYENALAAWRWGAERVDIVGMEKALDALLIFLGRSGRGEVVEPTLRYAVERLEGRLSGADLRFLAMLYAHQADYTPLKRNEEALALLEKCEALLSHSDLVDEDTRLVQALLLNVRASRIPDWDAKIRYFQQISQIYQDINDRWRLAWYYNNWAYIIANNKGVDQGVNLLHESLSIFREIGDQRGIARSLADLAFANLSWLETNLEESYPYALESVAINRKMGNPYGTAWSLHILGFCHLYSGKLDEAKSALMERISLYEEAGRQDRDGYYGLGMFEQERGEYDLAEEHYRIALDISLEKNRVDPFMAYAYNGLADIALVKGEYQLAEEMRESALNTWEQVRIRPDVVEILSKKGLLCSLLGDFDQAIELFKEALSITIEVNVCVCNILILSAVPIFLAARGFVERALETYLLVTNHPSYSYNSVWYYDIVGKRMEALAEGLPDELISTIHDRVKSMDVWSAAEQMLTLFENIANIKA